VMEPHVEALGCLARGSGRWVPANMTTEPYLMDRNFVPKYGNSPFWPGKCDDDLPGIAAPGRRRARPALQWSYRPAGADCAGLTQLSLLSGELQERVCRRYAGRQIVVVGDSVLAQVFESLAHLVGYRRTIDRSTNPCAAFKARRKAPQTVDVEASLCAQHEKTRPVVLRFLRNEGVIWDADENKRGRRRDGRGSAQMLCDWAKVATHPATAAVLLNRGHHHASDATFVRQANASLSALSRALVASGRSPRAIMWLSTFASLPACTSLPDPISEERADSVLRSLHGRYAETYHWGAKERQNGLARQLVERVGGSYLEFFHASKQRPGGRRGLLDRERNALKNRTVEDCVHWCLPVRISSHRARQSSNPCIAPTNEPSGKHGASVR